MYLKIIVRDKFNFTFQNTLYTYKYTHILLVSNDKHYFISYSLE